MDFITALTPEFQLIAAILHNAHNSTGCAMACFRSVPEAVILSTHQKICIKSIFDGRRVKLRRAGRARLEGGWIKNTDASFWQDQKCRIEQNPQ